MTSAIKTTWSRMVSAYLGKRSKRSAMLMLIEAKMLLLLHAKAWQYRSDPEYWFSITGMTNGASFRWLA